MLKCQNHDKVELFIYASIIKHPDMLHRDVPHVRTFRRWTRRIHPVTSENNEKSNLYKQEKGQNLREILQEPKNSMLYDRCHGRWKAT